MKSKVFIISTILLSTLIIASSTISAKGITTRKEPKYKINENISIPELKLNKNTYISDCKYMDINGDNVKDNVILIGTKKNKDDIYFANLHIIVRNGKTKKFIKSSLGKHSGGYEPTMFLGDFTGDKVPDIFVKMPTGGSGGIVDYSIINLKGTTLSVIWDSERFSSEIDLTGKFEDDFKAILRSKRLNKTFHIDLGHNRNQYIELNIYDKFGKLKENIVPWINGFSELHPIDTNKNGTYELIGIQRIVGTCNADTIGYLESEWIWDGKKIKLQVDKVKLINI